LTDRVDDPVAERVDAHHHVWDLRVRPQRWTAELPVLNRTFEMDELEPQLAASGVDGTVLVETINIPGETQELLELATKHPRVRGVVGWVDLTARDVADRIAALREAPGGDRLVGLRHQVQREPDPAWLTRPDVLRALAAVAESGLVFDLLVLPQQLGAAIDAVRRTEGGRFVLAHAGKPPIAGGALEPWATLVGVLAAYDNVACKLSGLATEASPEWSVTDLQPYAAHVLAVFGPDRVMAGSDWPVCLLRADYQTVWAANESLVAGMSDTERAQVLGGSATRWYGLS
jgi:L-fuconolactonase